MASYGQTASIIYQGCTLDNKEVFDSVTDEKNPFKFVIGAGTVPYGVELALYEMNEGDECTVCIPAEFAYGEYKEDASFKIPSYMIPNFDKLPIGKYIDIKTKEAPVPAHAKVVKVENCVAYFDLNHPLAGKDCAYLIKVLKLD